MKRLRHETKTPRHSASRGFFGERARVAPGSAPTTPLPPVPLLFSSPFAETCKRRRRSSGALILAAVFGRAHRQNAPPDRGRHPRQLPVRQPELLSSTCSSSWVIFLFFPTVTLSLPWYLKSRRGAAESHGRRVHTGALPPVFFTSTTPQSE